MKRTWRIKIVSLVIVSSLFFSCQSNPNKTELTEQVIKDVKTLNPEEKELKGYFDNKAYERQLKFGTDKK